MSTKQSFQLSIAFVLAALLGLVGGGLPLTVTNPTHTGNGVSVAQAQVVSSTTVTVTGPTMGTAGLPYSFSLTIDPLPLATTPLTYSWSPPPLFGQGLRHAYYQLGDIGMTTITGSVRHAEGTLVDTHAISLTALLLPLTAVSIDGPLTTTLDQLTNLTATVSYATPPPPSIVTLPVIPDTVPLIPDPPTIPVAPLYVTPPVTYSWSPLPVSGQGSALTQYQWSLTGTQQLSLTVSDGLTRVQDLFEVLVVSPPTITASVTPTPTATPTATWTPTPSLTPTPTPTTVPATFTPTPTWTPTPTPTPTTIPLTPTPTWTPQSPPTWTPTPTPSPTPTPTPTATATPTPTASSTPSPTPRPTATPTVTPTPEPPIIYLPLISRVIPVINLTINNLEVSQGIQTRDNRVPLVADRPARVRLFVGVENSDFAIDGVTAYLHAARNGVELATSPLTPSNAGGTLTAPLFPERENIEHSLNFALPNDWLTAGDLTVWVTLNPNRTILETNLLDNRSPDYRLTFQPVPPLQVVLLPIAYQDSATGRVYRPDYNPENNFGLGILQKIYPIPAVQYSLHAEYVYRGNLRYDADWSELLREIADLRAREQGQGQVQDPSMMPKYYGLLTDDDFADLLWGGVAYRPGTVGVGNVQSTTTGPHEIGHNLGLMHVNCGNPSNIDWNYPYFEGMIGQVGVDVYAYRVYSASYYRDLMSYCRPRWISDYNYRQMYEVLRYAQPSNRAAPRSADGYLIAGRINPDGTGRLAHAEPLLASKLVEPPGEGAYQLELLDSGNNVQFRYQFTPTKIAQEGPVPQPADFRLVLPNLPQATTIHLKRGADLLDSQTLATTPPLLTAAQTASRTGQPQLTTLSWQASPATRSGPSPMVNLRYSGDGGQTWDWLAVGRAADDTFDLDRRALPGSPNGLLEVVAVNRGQTSQQRFELGPIENKPPHVGIFGERMPVYRAHEPIIMAGAAFDLEDGSLMGDNLVWSTDTHGVLETGPTLNLTRGLPTGLYTLRLTATDQQGRTTQDHLVVTILSE